MLIKRADIAAARAVLQRAMAEGSAEAAFTLGETYDETMLSQWNVLGTQADAAKARELYRRASDAGYAPASQRLEITGRKQQ
jgi:TPR repeat protein